MSNAEWAKAFVAVQAEMPDITKDKTVTIDTRTGRSFTYSYADLPSIVDKTRGVLAKHGLAVAQSVESAEGKVAVLTRIYHSDGHVETFGPVVLPGGNDAQATGSAITYARRYALCAALGIAADEDDDGQHASKAAKENSTGASAPPSPATLASPSTRPEEVTDAGAHPPTKAAPDTATSSSRELGSAVAGEVAADPAAPAWLWAVIQEAVDKGLVSRTKIHMVAARLSTETSEPVPTKFPDVANCSAEVLHGIASHFDLVAAA